MYELIAWLFRCAPLILIVLVVLFVRFVILGPDYEAMEERDREIEEDRKRRLNGD